jgi:hypothetical protein
MGGYNGEGDVTLRNGIANNITYGPDRPLAMAGGGDGNGDGEGPLFPRNFFDDMDMDMARKSVAELGYHECGSTKWANAQLYSIARRFDFDKRAVGDAMFPENIGPSPRGGRTQMWHARLKNVITRLKKMGINLT